MSGEVRLAGREELHPGWAPWNALRGRDGVGDSFTGGPQRVAGTGSISVGGIVYIRLKQIAPSNGFSDSRDIS